MRAVSMQASTPGKYANRPVSDNGHRALTNSAKGPLCTLLAVLAGLLMAAASSAYAASPPIRISEANKVPGCVTPDRLMSFVATRNRDLLPRFRRIAEHYREHGERWRVRWDYAFYQMLIETNFLTYRQPNGKWGDVRPAQNNFAGIGTTGGGVPGNAFPDVSTGVLAQIQHLVVYSGEELANPVAPRTRLKQDVILKLSQPIAAQRPVTFQDLSGRWAVDKKYGRSIEYVARLFRSNFCQRGDETQVARRPGPPTVKPQTGTAAATSPASQPAGPVNVCKVQVAGSNGTSTLLIRSREGNTVRLTALDVVPDREDQLRRMFIATYAKGGRLIGKYESRDAAVTKAHAMCRQLTEAS
jgi:hypothetical protein